MKVVLWWNQVLRAARLASCSGLCIALGEEADEEVMTGIPQIGCWENRLTQDFLVSPVIKALCSQCRGMGSISDWGISHIMNGVGKNKQTNKQKTRLTQGASIKRTWKKKKKPEKKKKKKREPELSIKSVLEWGSHVISLYQMGALMEYGNSLWPVLWRVWVDLSPTPVQLGLWVFFHQLCTVMLLGLPLYFS